MNVIPTLPATPPPAMPGEGAAAATPCAAASRFTALMAALVPGAPTVPGRGAAVTAAVAEATDARPSEETDEAAAPSVDPAGVTPAVTGTPLPVAPVAAPTTADHGDCSDVVPGATATAAPGTGHAIETLPVTDTGSIAGMVAVPDAGPARTAEAGQPPQPAPQPSTPTPAPALPGPGQVGPAPAPVPGAPSGPLGPVPAPASPSPGVTQQLLPEVTRLVSRGDGTHRLTMTLQPEILGEVRVTLTVRQGEVHVRLAAGEEARAALLEGAPELQRVLELTGATDTRVVVRDLVSPGPSAAQSFAAADTGRGDTGATGHGRPDPDRHDAGTRRGTTARDGTSDGTSASRPEPVVLARSSGVDMTM